MTKPHDNNSGEKRCGITDRLNCDCKVCTGDAVIALNFPKPKDPVLAKARELSKKSLQELKPHSPNWVRNIEKYICTLESTLAENEKLREALSVIPLRDKTWLPSHTDKQKIVILTETLEGIDEIVKEALASTPNFPPSA